MELVYLYIDGYRNLNEAEFNFSQKIKLHYEKLKHSLKEMENVCMLPDDFWGENIGSLTMIVGNNGAGKTSLMHYVIAAFYELIYNQCSQGRGIIVLGDGEQLYCWSKMDFARKKAEKRAEAGGELRAELKVELILKSGPGGYHTCLMLENHRECVDILQSLKLVYMTNALSQADLKRNQRFGGERFDFLYDCSVGGVICSDVNKDVNQEMRHDSANFSELEIYFIYEQYKQIKFVFDKKQYWILQKLKNKGYPVPLPKKLYIDLLMDDQLRFVLLEKLNMIPVEEMDQILFPKTVNRLRQKKRSLMISEKKSGKLDEKDKEFLEEFLKYQLCRCCIFGALRSVTRIFGMQQRDVLYNTIVNRNRRDEEQFAGNEFEKVIQKLWRIFRSIAKEIQMEKPEWLLSETAMQTYLEFLRFVEKEKLINHFTVENSFDDIVLRHDKLSVLNLSVSVEDADWFMVFLQKYRYICNPDYFLDFRWGLSSGENCLLSMFASLYYIFDADYTNSKNGNYTIYNRLNDGKLVKCDSMILMVDEADLTFHPEWQREYVSLLTVFLTSVYPADCCRNIQVILSTHSPILLGDVPQQNVIYLKRDLQSGGTVVDNAEHAGTFGQNIHMLFKDSFFLEHGTMGHFAQRKIKELLERLYQIEKRLEDAKKQKNRQGIEQECRWILQNECRTCAELIAEPIIRRKLFSQIEMLTEKASQENTADELGQLSDVEIEKRIARLQKEQNRRRSGRKK